MRKNERDEEKWEAERYQEVKLKIIGERIAAAVDFEREWKRQRASQI